MGKRSIGARGEKMVRRTSVRLAEGESTELAKSASKYGLPLARLLVLAGLHAARTELRVRVAVPSRRIPGSRSKNHERSDYPFEIDALRVFDDEGAVVEEFPVSPPTELDLPLGAIVGIGFARFDLFLLGHVLPDRLSFGTSWTWVGREDPVRLEEGIAEEVRRRSRRRG